jgi:uncharacterized damage-inducible protein DinB
MSHAMNRRRFLGGAACIAAGAGSMLAMPTEHDAWGATPEGLGIIGPKPGYSPHIGTLSSMMALMRGWVIDSVTGMTMSDLDFLLDTKANTIGALLLHLAATETYYQLHTFDGVAWGKFPAAVTKKWDAASELGDAGRASIKGKELTYYLDALKEVRAKTLAEFKKRSDKWLFEVDKDWPWGPTNNYCKWFHVCEHESNHRGQIKFLKSRLPGAHPSSGG